MRVITHYSPITLFVVLRPPSKDPKMGTRVLRFIPNTPALVAWGQKPTTSHLSDLINGQTKGNILNSNKRCIAHMNKFS